MLVKMDFVLVHSLRQLELLEKFPVYALFANLGKHFLYFFPFKLVYPNELNFF